MSIERPGWMVGYMVMGVRIIDRGIGQKAISSPVQVDGETVLYSVDSCIRMYTYVRGHL